MKASMMEGMPNEGNTDTSGWIWGKMPSRRREGRARAGMRSLSSTMQKPIPPQSLHPVHFPASIKVAPPPAAAPQTTVLTAVRLCAAAASVFDDDDTHSGHVKDTYDEIWAPFEKPPALLPWDLGESRRQASLTCVDITLPLLHRPSTRRKTRQPSKSRSPGNNL